MVVEALYEATHSKWWCSHLSSLVPSGMGIGSRESARFHRLPHTLLFCSSKVSVFYLWRHFVATTVRMEGSYPLGMEGSHPPVCCVHARILFMLVPFAGDWWAAC